MEVNILLREKGHLFANLKQKVIHAARKIFNGCLMYRFFMYVTEKLYFA